jgi:hypothetical protein
MVLVSLVFWLVVVYDAICCISSVKLFTAKDRAMFLYSFQDGPKSHDGCVVCAFSSIRDDSLVSRAGGRHGLNEHEKACKTETLKG